MFIDDERVKSETTVPLKSGSKVCFGVNVDTNDLKYEFLCTEKGTASLKRCRDPNDSVEKIQLPLSATPPLSKGKRGLDDQCSGKNSSVPKKKLRLSDELDKPEKTKVKCSLERNCTTITQQKDTALSTNKSTTHPVTSTPKRSLKADQISSPASTKPSPALSVASTRSATSDIDALFEGEVVECTAVMEEAIFGESGSEKESAKVIGEWSGLDATALQIKLAQEQMDKEKHKLLSNIEALKSELEAKNQLLAEKDERTKAVENVNNSVVSSMQEEFTCVICQELFVNAYTLPCAHSFCEWCIKEWMKKKGHKDCPICRKKITSDPVHSLALDNAVSKLVEKLSPDEQKERKETETEHKNALTGLGSATKSGKRTKPPAVIITGSLPSSAGVSTRSRTRLSTTSSTSRPIVIDLSGPDRPTVSIHHPIVLDTSTESDSGSDSEPYPDSYFDSEESDSDPGMGGAYYGGYGRCFNCGKS